MPCGCQSHVLQGLGNAQQGAVTHILRSYSFGPRLVKTGNLPSTVSPLSQQALVDVAVPELFPAMLMSK